jgi:hypothetical protein
VHFYEARLAGSFPLIKMKGSGESNEIFCDVVAISTRKNIGNSRINNV